MKIKKQKIYKDCLICKTPSLVRHISRLERTKYCSKKCLFQSQQKEKKEIICFYCKKSYFTYPSNKERIFCSSKCRYHWQSSGSWPLAFYRNATEQQLIIRLKEYFNKNIIKKDGCWEWIGTKDKDGYGKINLETKNIKSAHRASWVIHNGDIPNKLWVLHTCDNPPCTNPKHLFLGTHQDNINDMVNKKRHNNGKKKHVIT